MHEIHTDCFLVVAFWSTDKLESPLEKRRAEEEWARKLSISGSVAQTAGLKLPLNALTTPNPCSTLHCIPWNNKSECKCLQREPSILPSVELPSCCAAALSMVEMMVEMNGAERQRLSSKIPKQVAGLHHGTFKKQC
jgi:hypothetical protein